MLELRPVRTTRKPQYPLKAYVIADPELLKKLPERWRKSRKVVAVVGLAASLSFTFTGCATEGVPLPSKYLSESDALAVIKNAADDFLPGLKGSVKTADSLKPITYIQYYNSTKSFDIIDVETGSIDLFDTDKGVGFEYLSLDTETGEPTDVAGMNKTIEKAGKNDAYVLIIDSAHEDDTASIKEQVEGFLTWLKAEGIL